MSRALRAAILWQVVLMALFISLSSTPLPSRLPVLIRAPPTRLRTLHERRGPFYHRRRRRRVQDYIDSRLPFQSGTPVAAAMNGPRRRRMLTPHAVKCCVTAGLSLRSSCSLPRARGFIESFVTENESKRMELNVSDCRLRIIVLRRAEQTG